jgi:methylmalonyl-CoA epimerase
LNRKIDHIGIAVRDLRAALAAYETVMDLEPSGIEEVPGFKTRVAMVSVGESRLEFLEPMADDSPIAGFIKKRGEGIHHLCFQVEDIAAELHRLKAGRIRLIDESPRPGAAGCLVAFLHPSGTAGVLIELSQPPSRPVEREPADPGFSPDRVG